MSRLVLAMRLRGLGIGPLGLLGQHTFLLLVRLWQESANSARWSESKYCCALLDDRIMFGTMSREGQCGGGTAADGYLTPIGMSRPILRVRKIVI